MNTLAFRGVSFPWLIRFRPLGASLEIQRKESQVVYLERKGQTCGAITILVGVARLTRTDPLLPSAMETYILVAMD
jgi:hypothetical protein